MYNGNEIISGSDGLSLHLTYISGRRDGERKEGCSLLPIGAEEYRALELPSGWRL
jgi:hypothetical protein